MRAREFNSLRQNIWINGIIIDCYVANCIDKWQDTTYIPTDRTPVMIGEFSSKRACTNRRMCKITFPINNLSLMRYVENSHWHLLVANVEQKKVCVLDLYGKGDDEVRAIKAFESFIKTVESSFSCLRKIEWEK